MLKNKYLLNRQVSDIENIMTKMEILTFGNYYRVA